MSGAEWLTASEAAARLSAGTLTAESLVRDCLERIQARAEVKAWVWLDLEQALAQARAADRAGRPGPLAGVPIGIKDVIDTVDMPTQHAYSALRVCSDHERRCWVVDRRGWRPIPRRG